MRVIAGEFRGRRLVAPKGTSTRPTADRVREALFSRLATLDALADARVLDAFAGAGTLGIEALSRGAAHATFVEIDRAALGALRANIEALGIGPRATVLPRDSFVAARSFGNAAAPFSLLFLDPPYRIDKSEVRGLIESLLSSGGLAVGAVVVWEHDSRDEPLWPEALQDAGTKRYGSTAVSLGFYEGGEGA